MKVNIGNDNFAVDTYRLVNKYFEKKYGKPYWSMEQEQLSNLDMSVVVIGDTIDNILNATINKIIAKIPKKVKVKIEKQDVWALDYTLAIVIAPALKKLKDAKSGSPWVDDADVPEHLRVDPLEVKKNEWDTDSRYHARWDYVIDEMIWTFEQHAKQNTYLDDEFNTNKAEFEAHGSRIDNGNRLFGKYYNMLWS
jgi:hypothetical protein